MAHQTALIHCSYHKCLTVYYQQVVCGVFHKILRRRRGSYKHFFSFSDQFYRSHRNYRLASLNNRALDLDQLEDFRLSRFIRDPRDLVVSGYHYHRAGAEPWCTIENPTPEDWARVGGTIPTVMRPGDSYTSYLRTCSVEEGLIAEMDFRKQHLESMLGWPTDDERIRVFRYEDVLGNENRVFRQLFSHYGLAVPEKVLGGVLASHFRAGRAKAGRHIRNPRAGQWRKMFTPVVSEAFERRFPGLAETLGYEPTQSRPSRL